MDDDESDVEEEPCFENDNQKTFLLLVLFGIVTGIKNVVTLLLNTTAYTIAKYFDVASLSASKSYLKCHVKLFGKIKKITVLALALCNVQQFVRVCVSFLFLLNLEPFS